MPPCGWNTTVRGVEWLSRINKIYNLKMGNTYLQKTNHFNVFWTLPYASLPLNMQNTCVYVTNYKLRWFGHVTRSDRHNANRAKRLELKTSIKTLVVKTKQKHLPMRQYSSINNIHQRLHTKWLIYQRKQCNITAVFTTQLSLDAKTAPWGVEGRSYGSPGGTEAAECREGVSTEKYINK